MKGVILFVSIFMITLAAFESHACTVFGLNNNDIQIVDNAI